MNLVDELHAIAATLTRAGIAYAVCGGVADIDIVITRSDVPRVLELVRQLGYIFAAIPMTFDEGTPKERHVQRVSKVEGREHLLLDLLLAEAAFARVLDDRVEVELPEGRLTVVSLPTLIRMKQLAGRAQDVADLEKLEAADEG